MKDTESDLEYHISRQKNQYKLLFKNGKNEYRKDLLYALYDSNENLMLKHGTKNVLKITAEFYCDLYTKQNCDENIQKELLNNVNKKP